MQEVPVQEPLRKRARTRTMAGKGRGNHMLVLDKRQGFRLCDLPLELLKYVLKLTNVLASADEDIRKRDAAHETRTIAGEAYGDAVTFFRTWTDNTRELYHAIERRDVRDARATGFQGCRDARLNHGLALRLPAR